MTEQEKDFKTALTESIGMVAVDGSSSPIAMIDLMDAHLSDRDKFAIGFVEWIGLNHWWKCTDTRFPATLGLYTNKINGDFKVEDGKTAPQLLDLYKQSLTKTDKR